MQVVWCLHDNDPLITKAQQLAERLQWPWLTTLPSEATLALQVTPDYLAIVMPNQPQFKPLYVDFQTGKHAYRLSHLHHEPLLKACRVKQLDRPVRLIDATAGLGRDALLLAKSGMHLTLLEQQPILACLLEDLLNRLQAAGISLDMQLWQGDALLYLQALSGEDRPDVIYLDPMFDHDATKTALVKKEAQILQQIASPPTMCQQQALLDAARQKAAYKVVVKRPRLATALAGQHPDHQWLGKHSRYDIYQTRN